jgi:hypothetical protein
MTGTDAGAVTAAVELEAGAEAIWSCVAVETGEADGGCTKREPTLRVPSWDMVAAAAMSSGRLRRAAKEAGRCPEEERPDVALVVMAPAMMRRKRGRCAAAAARESSGGGDLGLGSRWS